MATGNSVAFYYLNPAAIGGPMRPSLNGFTWNLNAVYREPQTNRKEQATEIAVETLDADNLVTVAAKLDAAVKAQGAALDFNVATIVRFPLSVASV
jgi:hypothetical protein